MSTFDYSTDTYHSKRHPELLASAELLVAWSHFAELAYFEDIVRGSSIMEFGGGVGSNLIAVSQKAQVCMVEPSSIGRRVAQENGIEAVKSLTELGMRRFDLILCRHVLEHLPNPLQTLLDMT